MHFKNQHPLIARRKATFSKSRRLWSDEGLTHRAERRESYRSDTDSRLLTQMKVISTLGAMAASHPHSRSLRSRLGKVVILLPVDVIVVFTQTLLAALRDRGPARAITYPPNKGVQ
jgi:hypothetical protein